jgi:hypothetical protein
MAVRTADSAALAGGGIRWQNIATFSTTAAGAVQTFTVPAGVTKIAVEAWAVVGRGGQYGWYI